jgi:hypothetical protein
MAATIETTRRATNPATGSPLSALEIMQASCPETITLFPSASRIATVSSEPQHNIGSRGVIVDMTITDAGTATIYVAIERWSEASKTWVAMLTSVSLFSTNTTATLTLFPGATASANVAANATLPRLWRVTVTHLDVNPVTYAVGISTLN